MNIEKLKELGFVKQLTFAYLTCERLFPNYVYFSNNFDFGNPTVLREAIDYLYLNIFEKNSNENKINFFIKEVNQNTPDTENFSTIFVSSALDTCTAINESLGFLVDKNFARIKYISSYATDTITMYIQEKENLDLSKNEEILQKINNHSLMKKEIAMQSGIIAFLENSKTMDYGDIQTLLRLQDSSQGSLGL